MATASALKVYTPGPGVLMTNQWPDILDAAFKDIMVRAWTQKIQGLQYYTEQDTTRASEKYSAASGLALVPRSGDTDDMPRSDAVSGFDVSITPLTYRLGVLVERRLRETDQFGVINKLFSGLNESARDTIELYAALPFNTAFSTTVDWICADGMNLCDKTRYREDLSAGTWDNEDTTAALSQSSIATMRLNFRKNLNERGRKRPMQMGKIAIPSDLEDTTITELKTVKKPGSSLNDENFLTYYGINYQVWNWLTSTTAFFGFAPKDSLYELYWLWGSRPSEMDWNCGNPDVFGKRIRMVFQTGCVRPHSIRGNPGA